MELAKVGSFEDEDLSLEAAQTAVDYLVSGRLTVQEYACLIVHRSAQNLEAQALARVAPKVRREAWAKDAGKTARYGAWQRSMMVRPLITTSAATRSQ